MTVCLQTFPLFLGELQRPCEVEPSSALEVEV